MEITPIPEVPNELIIAAKAGRLVPFIGAGVSMLAGCPSWNDLANMSLKTFIKYGSFNLSRLEQIKHLPPRVKLSIAKSLQKEGEMIDFNKFFAVGNNDAQKLGEELYSHLSDLSETFVTTNYDRWLDTKRKTQTAPLNQDVDSSQSLPLQARRIIYKKEDLTPELSPNTVIHLHGSLEDQEQMVLTTQDYVSHYANDRGKNNENRVLTFLEFLFSERNVLFIGYGLEELEILEYIIQKAKFSVGKNEKKHFMLQGFFSHEAELARAMESYYLKECGIQLLPFSKDKKDWHQLSDVIKAFAQIIPYTEPLAIQELQDMRALLND